MTGVQTCALPIYDSFASMSPYVQWVVTIFMILFGVNFNAYFLLVYACEDRF